MLDVIALIMPVEQCLDYCTDAPMDQSFRRKDPNLQKLKKAAQHKRDHLTMVIVLDEEHFNHRDAFGGVFKGDTLTKKKFTSLKTSHGKEASAIVYAFCPFACSNDGYAYKQLAALHLNILWGAGSALTMWTTISPISINMFTLTVRKRRESRK